MAEPTSAARPLRPSAGQDTGTDRAMRNAATDTGLLGGKAMVERFVVADPPRSACASSGRQCLPERSCRAAWLDAIALEILRGEIGLFEMRGEPI
jgi:hypothetical protein